MNKQELALQYFPEATAATAVRHLTRWMARCRPLAEALEQSGYQSRNRTFTRKQVLLIQGYLGEPDTASCPPPERLFPVDGHKRTQTDTADLPDGIFVHVRKMRRTGQACSTDRTGLYRGQARHVRQTGQACPTHSPGPAGTADIPDNPPQTGSDV